MIAIKVENLVKEFGETKALNGIHLDFAAGSMHGLIGPEGAGKTTLLRHLVGLLQPQSGKILYGEDQKKINFADLQPFYCLYASTAKSVWRSLHKRTSAFFQRPLWTARTRVQRKNLKNFSTSLA